MASFFDLLAKYDQLDKVVQSRSYVLLAPKFRKWQYIPGIHHEAISESSKNTG